ncbi:hypothetical protein AUQ44_01640 [Vibrio cidicii]|uniref:Uncharacterized protein n=1 Tax=Vibrio cidicii TaxID=1763883 RepID=A0A151JFT6_9VIBR|nr:hypothetical protein AUQ44_01640 [Vibrio cidicii]
MAIRFWFLGKSALFSNVSLSRCLNWIFGLLEVSKFGAKSLLKFCFRYEFFESDLSKISVFQIA